MPPTRMLRAAAVLAAPTLAVIALAPSAHAATYTPPSRQRTIQERVEPGVELIENDITVMLAVPAWQFDGAALDKLFQLELNRALDGEIGSDAASIINAQVDEIVAHPLDYVVPDGGEPVIAVDQEIGLLGTAFTITPDGYLVTAAHVVAPNRDEVKDALQQDVLSQLDAQDKALVAKDNADLNAEQQAKLLEAVRAYEAHYLQITDLKSRLVVQMGVGVPGLGTALKGTPVSLVGAPGEAYPGKDVAVLKLDGFTNLPTVPLAASDDTVHEGDTLYVAGYPAAALYATGGASNYRPTVTDGPLTAKKSTDDGVPVLQTQAAASPGNSGGPVLDGNGQVIGILVAGALNSDGTAAPGVNLVVPISVVTQFLNERNVHPTQGNFTLLYNKALDDVDRGYFKRAAPQLQDVLALNPGNPYVSEQLSAAKQAILEGKDQTPEPASPLPLIIGIGAGVLAGLVVLLALLRRRSSKAKRAAAATAALPAPGLPLGFPPPPAPFSGPGPSAYGRTVSSPSPQPAWPSLPPPPDGSPM